MNKMSLRLAVTSLLLAASAGSMAASTVNVPIEINGVLQEIPGVNLRCQSKFGGTIIGRGEGAVTGPVAFVANDCITQGAASFTFSAGKMIIIAVAGDQIFADYSGQFVPTGEGTKYVFNGATFQVTGGTGKFFKATGGGTLTGGEDMSTGAGTIKLAGTISYKK